MSLEALEKRFTELQDRLTLLQDATNQLRELIDRLANLDFQPGSVPLGARGDDDNNVGSELSSEINQILREQEEELELLREEIIDIRPGRPGGTTGLHHDKDRLEDGAQRVARELQSCRTSFRKAQITAKRNLQLVQRQERELLYASMSNPRSGASSPAPSTPNTTSAPPWRQHRQQKKQRSELSREEQMVGASSDVTRSMRRTHDLMTTELSRSDFAHNALRESTAALSQLSDHYSGLDDLLQGSRALLGTLLRSNKTDTWYLRSAFYLLAATLAWLAFRRLLWGPLWWLVWLPLKLLFRAAVGGYGVVAGSGRPASGSGSDPASVNNAAQQQRQRLVDMNNEGVSTIQVAQQQQPPAQSQVVPPAEGEEGGTSLVDEIGQMIDESKNNQTPEQGAVVGDDDTKEGTVLGERGPEEQPSPEKGLGEEEDVAGPKKGQRVRDEL
ncbi:Sec20-domain-containing protein [Xylariaceae sp. FL0804]|nr:Sec20-domain-containing protein [Xylariaceae sp. FL0804]